MDTIYFDNAATTQIDPEVIDVMKEVMELSYGNPSSTHQIGRKAKVLIETARKNIAKHFDVDANQVVFTSSGTEGNNLVLNNAVENLGVKRIITSKIEHHAVLHVVENLEKKYAIEVEYVQLNETGVINLSDLEDKLAKSNKKTLVSLMLVNNEIGNILPVKEVSGLCKEYKALFHSDIVQFVGNNKLSLKETPVDFVVASAHKFHGPKGVGFICFNRAYKIAPMILGGNQEKGIRSSTENVHAIVGMYKALVLSSENMEENKSHILSVKKYFCQELKKIFPDVIFNGQSSDENKSSVTIVNVRFPFKDKMFLFSLDMFGIMASSGSACQSGSSKVSHVLKEILNDEEIQKTSIRFSFSRFSTTKEVDLCVEKIAKKFKKR